MASHDESEPIELAVAIRRAWRRFWALSWWWKGSAAGGAVLVLMAAIIGVALARGDSDNTAVSGVFQAPTPTATSTPGVTPTLAQTPTPTPHPTPSVEPSPTPSPAATTSAAQEEEPPGVANPPVPSAETPTPAAPKPPPTPTPMPTPTPTPTPTPDPLGRIPPAYWIDARGDVVIYVYYPDLTCQEDFRVGQISCRSATRGWTLNCSSAGTRWSCSHSIDGSVSCLWDRNPPHDTSCIGAVWDGSCGNAYVQNIPTTTCRRTDTAGSESVVCSWSGLTATCEWQGHLTFRCVRATSSWSCSGL